MIRFYNTAARNKQDFKPINDDRVSLYTCGPTVYGELQIGNWLAYLRWDILVRLLQVSGYDVRRVMNITDVGHLVSDADEGEDKMEKGARRDGTTAWEVSQRYTDSFLDGMTQLNLVPPTELAKATEFIDQQIELIKRLEAGGHTYRTDDGIYFDISTFDRYADFAQLPLEQLRPGARVEVNDKKRQPADFALWKFSPSDHQRDMEWDSPWGVGFPGWHLECSAIAMELLGETIDIHTGGIDHIPVHHTNEIAQSEAATGQTFAHYWLHANFLLVGGTKISKSLDNGYTLSQLIERGYSPNDFRMFSLQSHYRTESNFTWENLDAASNRLKRWYRLAELRWQIHDTLRDDEDKAISDISLLLRGARKKLLDVLADDMNTPELLRLTEEYFDQIDKQRAYLQQDVLVEFLEIIEQLTGLQLLSATADIDEVSKALLLERQRARENQDYDQADKLRGELTKQGLIVRDDSQGQIWSRF